MNNEVASVSMQLFPRNALDFSVECLSRHLSLERN
jgi:hypothetical protein